MSPAKDYTNADIEAAIASNTQLVQPGKTRNDDHIHGTHVAGIAAGTGVKKSGCSDPYTYVGVAPEAQLVIVKFDLPNATAKVIDAITFIENQAKTAVLPCVINMSWGHTIGPHDGTDPLDVILDNYLSARIAGGANPLPVVLVASAGNSGGLSEGAAIPLPGQDSHVEGSIPANGSKSITFAVDDVIPEAGNSS